MSRPPKPVAVLKSEGKSHRTKREIKQREEGEKSLISGVAIKEFQNVKDNLIAHGEFERIIDLLQRIEKDDAIYQSVINRYCLLFSECDEIEKNKAMISRAINCLEETFDEAVESLKGEGVNLLEYIIEFSGQIGKLNANYIALDKQLQTKRKMMLDVEKENVMTIASALRNIPKKEEPKTNALMQALKGG